MSDPQPELSTASIVSHQPTDINFPKMVFGKGKNIRTLSFRTDWYKKFPCLGYDVSTDIAFCITCRTASKLVVCKISLRARARR